VPTEGPPLPLPPLEEELPEPESLEPPVESVGDAEEAPEAFELKKYSVLGHTAILRTYGWSVGLANVFAKAVTIVVWAAMALGNSVNNHWVGPIPLNSTH
jgi:hypothetical protein